VVSRALDDLGSGDVTLAIPDHLPEIFADPALLERVLVNLISNALRYTPAGESVLVTASALGNSVEIRVIDRGPGIPEDERDRVFEPFQRLGDRDNHSGVGLGLALSRGLAEAMGGGILPDETPGGGVTMILTLPVSPRTVGALESADQVAVHAADQAAGQAITQVAGQVTGHTAGQLTDQLTDQSADPVIVDRVAAWRDRIRGEGRT
jgi:K+-sensing histidine kinase KdpD